MNKKWIRYALSAVIILAAGFFILRNKNAKNAAEQIATNLLTTISESENSNQAEETESSSLQIITDEQTQTENQNTHTSDQASTQNEAASQTTTSESITSKINKNGTYTSKAEVALYIHTYNTLPQNFITKTQAKELGWSGGSLEPYAPGKSIGGDRFGNYEGLLPKQSGRKYTECDIDTKGKKSRGAKRIVFSNDGLIYYTGDHYKTFELLYGNPEEN